MILTQLSAIFSSFRLQEDRKEQNRVREHYRDSGHVFDGSTGWSSEKEMFEDMAEFRRGRLNI